MIDARITRVVAALDTNTPVNNVLATAVDLAARFGVEVTGIFVEDLNLFRLSELTLARALTGAVGESRIPTVSELEAQFRMQSARAASKLGSFAVRQGVKWSFRNVRGLPTEQLIAATTGGDLVVVGGAPTAGSLYSFHVESPLDAAARSLERMTFLVRTAAAIRRPLVVADSRSRVAAHAVAVAERLTADGAFDVLVIGDLADAELTINPPLGGTLLSSRTANADSLLEAARRSGSDLFVLATDLVSDDDDFLNRLVRREERQILIVR